MLLSLRLNSIPETFIDSQWVANGRFQQKQDKFLNSKLVYALITWVYWVMDARGKFGEHEITFLSVLQTLQMHLFNNYEPEWALSQ